MRAVHHVCVVCTWFALGRHYERNMEALSQTHTVYAIDLLGQGECGAMRQVGLH